MIFWPFVNHLKGNSFVVDQQRVGSTLNANKEGIIEKCEAKETFKRFLSSKQSVQIRKIMFMMKNMTRTLIREGGLLYIITILFRVDHLSCQSIVLDLLKAIKADLMPSCINTHGPFNTRQYWNRSTFASTNTWPPQTATWHHDSNVWHKDLVNTSTTHGKIIPC